MKIITLITLIILNFSFSELYSQDTATANLLNTLPEGLKLNAYIDTYYASDNDEGNYQRQFSFVAPFRDDFKLNFLSLAARYSANKFRANAVIHFGDVPYLSWPSDNKFIQEANIGFSPAKKFWIDAGYFITHIGGEGLIPKYNPLTILTLCTSYEPWIQSGVRLSYDFSDKLSVQLHLVNSFNVFTDMHKHKSAGMQIDYHPSEKFDIVYNNLFGDESPMPDSIARFRLYNNLVVKFNPSKKINITLCTDFSTQAKSTLPNLDKTANVYSGFATVKYYFAKKFSFAVRGEFYSDKDGILSGLYKVQNNMVGLRAYGLTLGLEYNPVEFGFIRIESRYLKTSDHILYNGKDNRIEGILTFGAEI